MATQQEPEGKSILPVLRRNVEEAKRRRRKQDQQDALSAYEARGPREPPDGAPDEPDDGEPPEPRVRAY
jgi:hypothetical protein